MVPAGGLHSAGPEIIAAKEFPTRIATSFLASFLEGIVPTFLKKFPNSGNKGLILHGALSQM